MNREIKFRAWDGETMREVYELSFTKRGRSMRCRGGRVGTLFDDEEVVSRHAVLMQFTGLKDKNGKEIYEGDFIETERGIFRVRWSGAQAKFYGMDVNIQKTVSWLAENGEIIGNTYENPELLTHHE